MPMSHAENRRREEEIERMTDEQVVAQNEARLAALRPNVRFVEIAGAEQFRLSDLSPTHPAAAKIRLALRMERQHYADLVKEARRGLPMRAADPAGFARMKEQQATKALDDVMKSLERDGHAKRLDRPLGFEGMPPELRGMFRAMGGDPAPRAVAPQPVETGPVLKVAIILPPEAGTPDPSDGAIMLEDLAHFRPVGVRVQALGRRSIVEGYWDGDVEDLQVLADRINMLAPTVAADRKVKVNLIPDGPKPERGEYEDASAFRPAPF